MRKPSVKRRPERLALRVIKGGFAPADNFTIERLRAKGYRVNDLVFAEMKKPRNPRFYRLAHAFGTMVSENIEAFDGVTAHGALKRIQLEANIGCEEVAYMAPGFGLVEQRIPKSLSFESMDDGEFREVFLGMCRHIASTYWPEMSEQEIAEMAEVMVGE